MVTVVYNFLSAQNVRSPELASDFFEALNTHLQNAAPRYFGSIEPLDRKFQDDFSGACNAWSENLFWRNQKVNSYGRVFHGTPTRHGTVKMYFDVDCDESDVALVEFLRDVGTLLKVDYASLHVLRDESQLPEDEMLEGFTSKDIRRYLPTIPWGACYGQPYIELFGRDKIDAASYHKIEWLSEQLVFCQLTPNATDYVKNYDDFRSRQLKVKQELGLEYFFDPDKPNAARTVPDFVFG